MKESSPHKKIGVLICGTGIGIGIAANRFEHVLRCANDANCISERHISMIVLLKFISTEFEGGRHQKD